MSTDIYLEAAVFIIRERIRHATGALKCKPATKRHAVAWVMSDSIERGSFLRWADAAGVDAAAIRADIC